MSIIPALYSEMTQQLSVDGVDGRNTSYMASISTDTVFLAFLIDMTKSHAGKLCTFFLQGETKLESCNVIGVIILNEL